MTYRRVLLVTALLLSVLCAPAAVQARPAARASAHTPRASSALSGIALTLSLPRRVYPRNALARVQVVARNISRRSVALGGIIANSICFGGDVGVDSRNSAGQTVSPTSPVPLPPPPPCPFPPPQPFPPGKTISIPVYVVLYTPHLHAWLRLYRVQGKAINGSLLATASASVRLTAAAPPRITRQGSGGDVTVSVERPAGVHGSMFYRSWAVCGSGGARGPGVGQTLWAKAPSTRLTPPCTPVVQWHVDAAWLGHSVASLDYTSPTPSGTPGPPIP